MATSYKILGQVSPAANTANTVYTVPAATTAVVSTINICNLDGVNRTFRVAAVKSGDSLSSLVNRSYLAYETVVPSNDSISLTLGITLGANDNISVFANSTANLAFNVFGSEIT
jgi:hypothetical protein